MRSRHTLRRALRCAAVAAATVAATLAAPAAPAAASSPDGAPAALPLLPKPWSVTLGAAKAGGTVTYRQDPLGVMGHWTVKGTIDAPGDGDCYYVQITAGRTWNSPPACGPGTSDPFVVTFDQPVIKASGTGRLCAARPEPDVCGTPVRIW